VLAAANLNLFFRATCERRLKSNQLIFGLFFSFIAVKAMNCQNPPFSPEHMEINGLDRLTGMTDTAIPFQDHHLVST
jgi:hypothetical protein